MNEDIKEFLEKENLKHSSEIKIVNKEGKNNYIKIEDFLKKYHMFLRKKSYLK